MAISSYRFPKKTIKEIPIHDKRVLLRADFNVPLSSDGEIESDYRVTQTLPTLEYLLKRHCRVVVIAHLGRPEGKPDKNLSLEPIAQLLRELLPDYSVTFVPSATDDVALQACKKMPPGSLVLLENLRFYDKEEANDPAFAQRLREVSGADYFVQDGFGVVHRAHASTEAITHQLPSVAGLLLESEVTHLEKVMKHPEHPLVAVVGGAKISDKIGFIEQLLGAADTVLIGGAMANTFLKYQGFAIGKSKFETGQEAEIEAIFSKAKADQIVLPEDLVVTKKIEQNARTAVKNRAAIEPDDFIVDVGPKTMQTFDHYLQAANTAIWNGTLGLAEIPGFDVGSAELAENLADQHHSLQSIVGGGDTADFVLSWLSVHPQAHFSHISTGGGASLELMSGLKLPGLEALIKA